MSWIIAVSSAAERDIAVAYSWYEEQREGLGSKFIAEVERCFEKISTYPLLFGFLERDVRKCSLRNFPFIILYIVDGKFVRVISVFHTRRQPLH